MGGQGLGSGPCYYRSDPRAEGMDAGGFRSFMEALIHVLDVVHTMGVP